MKLESQVEIWSCWSRGLLTQLSGIHTRGHLHAMGLISHSCQSRRFFDSISQTYYLLSQGGVHLIYRFGEENCLYLE